MNAAESGLTSFTEAIDESRKARQVELDEMNGKIDVNIEQLTTTGYSLGSTYYEAANTFTKGLRERYLAEEGNPGEQHKIKMELNVASQNIQTTKTTIEEVGVAWEADDIEKSALNPTEQKIMEIAMDPDGKYAVWIEGENTFGWKNPETGEVYTLKQVQDIQKLTTKDYAAKKEFIEYESKTAENSFEFRVNGKGDAFNEQTETFNNEKRITKENIRFFINGDFTGDGAESFSKILIDHPEWEDDIFNSLSENPEAVKKYDTFPTPDGDGKVSIEDFTGVDARGFTLTKSHQMEKVYNAITDTSAVGFDFDVTKKLIAEYMTNRARIKFYGGKKKFDNMKNISATVTDMAKFDSWDAYVEAGGNIGYAKQVLGWKRAPAELYPKGHRKQYQVKKKAQWYKNINVGFGTVL
jgi:uncharacterized cupredoxin-like copper-binding protein